MRLATLGALAATAAALAGPATARAFDTGPHADMTRDAMGAEGFNRDAAEVGRIDNWFVDFYSNAEKIPFSGHADLAKLVAGGGFVVADHERWSKQLVAAPPRRRTTTPARACSSRVAWSRCATPWRSRRVCGCAWPPAGSS